jgi:hypothetical protein
MKGKSPGLKALHICVIFRGLKPSAPSGTAICNCSTGAFSEDEYQSCSGIGHGVNKKTVVEEKDSAGAEQAAEKLRGSV